MHPRLHLIVAHWKHTRGIGFGNKLPWPLIKCDMDYFKTTTIGNGNNAVIMGRNTASSIPEQYMPLANRRNIICSSLWYYHPHRMPLYLRSITCVPSLDRAIAAAHDCSNIFVIGGSLMYQAALRHDMLNTIYASEIDLPCNLEFDTYVPEFTGFNLKQSCIVPTQIQWQSRMISGCVDFQVYQKK